MRYSAPILLFALLIISCQMQQSKSNNSDADLAEQDTTTAASSPSYAMQSGTLTGDEAGELVDRIAMFEDLIGTPEDKIKDLFGEPIDVEFKQRAIDERDAMVYYFEYPVSELSNIYLNATVQHGKLVGIQLSSRENAELIYSSTRYLLASRGIEWTPGGKSRDRYVARSGRYRLWQIDFKHPYHGRTAVINVGTYKYSMCELAWDIENLWGTDGFGNPIDESNES